MSFAWDIEIPASTSEADPVEEKLQLTFGVVTKVEVKFPDGCHGLVKVRLLRGGLFQLVPLNPDEWVRADGETVSYRMYYPLDDEPRVLDFVGCSPGTAYDHTVTVRVEILKEEVASPWPGLKAIQDLTAILRRLLGI